MKNQIAKIVLYACLIISGTPFIANALEGNYCHAFAVQVPNQCSTLNENDHKQVSFLAKELSNIEISAIYCSKEPCAQEVAKIIANEHGIPYIIEDALDPLTLSTFFKRVKGFRTFAKNLTQKHIGTSIVVIAHANLIRALGKYVHSGFTGFPDFSCTNILADEQGAVLQIMDSEIRINF